MKISHPPNLLMIYRNTQPSQNIISIPKIATRN